MTAVDDIPAVVDPIQLRRIEALHRGFLYQHLYAAACLLTFHRSGAISLRTEADEDVEVRTADKSLYIQVKTRAEKLTNDDISGALERFQVLRELHKSGVRTGTALFYIVTNAPPSPQLFSEIQSDSWSSDVQLKWPDSKALYTDNLPPAWPTLASALSWCIAAAESIPYRSISPETLVWKLAAVVQFTATGQDAEHLQHTIVASELANLFEQIVRQLQEFPALPSDYRSQSDEPVIDVSSTKIIVGLSGSGKSIWASSAALHYVGPTAYFDVADLPGPAIATSLARELAARLLGARTSDIGAALSSGSGLDALKALNQLVDKASSPIAFIDNAHHVSAKILSEVVHACPNVKFILLCQPFMELVELEALLATRSETLKGWDVETVAQVFGERSCTIDPATAVRWHAITGGMPLFVKNAAEVTSQAYGGNSIKFVSELENGRHISTVAQEIILGRAIEALSADARRVLAAASLVTCPLTRPELDRVLSASGQNQSGSGKALRELMACGGLQVYIDGRLKIHDAIRLVAKRYQQEMSASELLSTRTVLKEVLYQSLLSNNDLARLDLWLHLLPQTGDVQTLIDLATREAFHEVGNLSELKSVLEYAVNTGVLDDVAQFWGLDALAFWDIQDAGIGADIQDKIERMEALLKRGMLGERERVALALKKLASVAGSRDRVMLEQRYKEAMAIVDGDGSVVRILRYNRAAILFKMGDYVAALHDANSIADDYFSLLGLSRALLFGMNPPDIIAKLGPKFDEYSDDLKHLADCLELSAESRLRQEQDPALDRLYAMKLFATAGAFRSSVKSGQGAVDDFIRRGDCVGARAVAEGQLIPFVRQFELTTNKVSVHGQYAVVLAYCGDFVNAQKEIDKLRPYRGSLDEDAGAELANQIDLIRKIQRGQVTLPSPRRMQGLARQLFQNTSKPRFNDICPCGSGKKYKRCCFLKN